MTKPGMANSLDEEEEREEEEKEGGNDHCVIESIRQKYWQHFQFKIESKSDERGKMEIGKSKSKSKSKS